VATSDESVESDPRTVSGEERFAETGLQVLVSEAFVEADLQVGPVCEALVEADLQVGLV